MGSNRFTIILAFICVLLFIPSTHAAGRCVSYTGWLIKDLWYSEPRHRDMIVGVLTTKIVDSGNGFWDFTFNGQPYHVNKGYAIWFNVDHVGCSCHIEYDGDGIFRDVDSDSIFR